MGENMINTISNSKEIQFIDPLFEPEIDLFDIKIKVNSFKKNNEKNINN